MLERYRISWRLFFVALWLILTLSMAGWWMFFSISLVDRLGIESPDLLEQKNMLFWEGIAWMILLLGGGLTLSYFVFRERAQQRQIRAFVAAFTHDLKTSLASMRLQAESLKQDLEGQDNAELAARLAADTVRLQLQLENSIYLAGGRELKLFYEKVQLSELVRSLSPQWPQLELEVREDCFLRADRKALTSVFSNLIQNAVVHGRATKLEIACEPAAGKTLRLQIRDNGSGFHGRTQDLGQLFFRHNPSSGSGIGLFIVHQLVLAMAGKIRFASNPGEGFRCEIRLEGALV